MLFLRYLQIKVVSLKIMNSEARLLFTLHAIQFVLNLFLTQEKERKQSKSHAAKNCIHHSPSKARILVVIFSQYNLLRNLNITIVFAEYIRPRVEKVPFATSFWQVQTYISLATHTWRSHKFIAMPWCLSWGNDKYECLVFVCRRGLLAYVYNGVSLTMIVLNALVAGNGSYIVRPCGHDLHGPTSPFVRQN